MVDTEIIQDNTAKLQILEEVKNNRLPVQVGLLDGDYDAMTHVNAIRQRRGKAYFRTESSRSFAAAIGREKNWRSWFDFFGKDNVQYVFRTTGWKVGGDGIWHKFPEIIERKQRRKYFRLELPLQTGLFLSVGSGQYKMTAIDISIGGILGELMDVEGPTGEDPPWRVGDRIKDIVLETDFERKSNRVHVQEGVLRRFDIELSSKKYKYAVEFAKMTKPEETALVELVYELQRKILKERIKINA
jgi:c-di-GMP-binding flagellar brake protein YcgR